MPRTDNPPKSKIRCAYVYYEITFVSKVLDMQNFIIKKSIINLE